MGSKTKVVFSKGGTNEHVELAGEIRIPDLWDLVQDLKRKGDLLGAKDALATWHIAHSLLRHVLGKDYMERKA